MWLSLAFLSAALLGLYDVAKKKSLSGNAVLPVLLLNTLFSSLLFLPAILSAELGLGWFDSTPLAASRGTAEAHALVAVKSVIVLTSWIFGYFGMKHLPLTIVGPVNATRPVLVLVGALAVFGERLQRIPVDRRGAGADVARAPEPLGPPREGVDFRHNVWILCLAAAAVTGAASGLYDKYIMTRLDPAFVQSWYNLYQLGMMTVVTALLWLPRRAASPFRWSWAIPLISVFLSAADFAYFCALREPDAMISVVSMVRRGSVVVSFLCGALLFGERNLRAKAVDLGFVLLGMLFLWLGSR